MRCLRQIFRSSIKSKIAYKIMRAVNAYSLKSFYNSRKGQIVRDLIRVKIQELCPQKQSKKTIGYGYALPYLKKFEHAFNMMPEQLGVHNWPSESNNRVCLHRETLLPLETNSIDFVLMVHGLEFLDNPEETFEEIWRVLKSTGRVLIVVPNRMGLWARADWSPFGQGRPYSARQVEHFLSDNLFIHERTTHALFSPPFEKYLFLQAAHIFEKIGAILCPALGGVHIIEASKQLYAGTGKTVKSGRSNLQKVVSANSIATPIQNPRVQNKEIKSPKGY